MRFLLRLILTLPFVFLISITVHAADNNGGILEEQMNALDYSEVETVISKNPATGGIDLKGLVLSIVNGEWELSPGGLWDSVRDIFLSEIVAHSALMRNLLLLAFLSALLKNLSLSFKADAVSELGFYSVYIALIMILYSSFEMAADIVRTLIDELVGLMQAAVPLMVSLVYLSGNFINAQALNPLVMFCVQILSTLIRDFIVPLIILAATVQIINYLSQRDILLQFSKLLEKGVSFALKATAAAFVSLLAFQGITAPIVNNTVNKTAKYAMNSLPVVGEVLTNTVDIVLTYGKAIKGGTMAGLLIIIAAICAVQIIKLGVMVAVYKVIAALIQPICDIRIVKCLDTVGTFVFLLFEAAVTVVIMFIFAVIIMLSF